MTTALLTSCSMGRMARCDPLPPPPPSAHPTASASLMLRLSPSMPLPVSVTLRPRRSPSSPLRGSPSAPPLSVLATLRSRRSPSSPLSVCRSPSSSLSVLAALRPPLSVLVALRPRRSPSSPLSVRRSPSAALRPPLSVLAALRPRRSPSSPRSARLSVMAALRPPLSVLSTLRPRRSPSVALHPRRSRHEHAAAARSRRSALLTPVSRPPQVEIMPCSNHITGISAANVRKVSNVTRDTLKQTLEIRLRLHSLSFSQVTDSIMNSCTYSGPYSDNFHREGTLHTRMTRNPTRTPTRGLHFARHGTVTSRLSNRRLRGSLRTNDVNDIHTPGRTASSATQGARVV